MKNKFYKEIPVRVNSPNMNGHWSKKYKENVELEKMLKYMCKEIKNIKLPCRIKLTRKSPGTLDDDNLVGSFKKVRDVIADMLIPGLNPGQADSDQRMKWKYYQKKEKTYSICIEIEEMLQ